MPPRRLNWGGGWLNWDFLPGEAVRIVAKGLMARAPIAVRIGTGTFALRLFEAACIRVCPEQPQPA